MFNKLKQFFASALGIFFLYTIAAGIVIMGYNIILSGREAPLPYFINTWRILQGLLDYIRLFPAIALTALILPFGFQTIIQDKFSSFSPKFLQSMSMSIISAITGALVYGFLSFLLLPMAQNNETNLIFQGQLFWHAKGMTERHAGNGEWTEAAQFLAVCESIWPDSPEMQALKIETAIQIDSRRVSIDPSPRQSQSSPAGVLGSEEINSIIAFEMAEIALSEGRFFDAHYLATLGGQLAPPNSQERIISNQIAGRAWNGVNATEPDLLAHTSMQTETHRLFRMKLEAYNALLGGEYIRAYYSFLDLGILTPEDPDLPRLLALSEEGLINEAFFIDEMEMSLGRVYSNVVYSLPYGTGRMVMRIYSLTSFSDTSYGMNMELIAFNGEGQPLWSISSPYIKLQPVTVNSEPAVSMLMRAVDRTDISGRWEFSAVSINQNHPFYDNRVDFILPVSWDNFILLSNISRGLSTLSTAELDAGAANLSNYGYPKEIFQTELLQRFIRPVFFLPFAIIVLSTAWRFRAINRPRYTLIPMLGILPVVINGMEQFAKSWVNNLGIWAVLSLGFNTAAVSFGIGIIVLLVLSLILLSSQHS